MPVESKIALYSVTDCCGKHLVYVTIDAVPDFEDEPAFEVRYDAMRKAGYSPGIVCGGCYDNAYRAQFVNWVDEHIIGE